MHIDKQAEGDHSPTAHSPSGLSASDPATARAPQPLIARAPQPLIAHRTTLLSSRYLSSRLLLAGLVASLLGLAAMSIDLPVSTTLRQWKLPGDLAKAIALSETFAHSLGAAAILLSAFVLAPTRRRAILAAMIITLACGLTSNLLKACFPRVRPHSSELIRVAVPGEFDFSAGVAAPRLADGRELVPVRLADSRQRSFPSGHSATAWGLALGLSLVFPRGLILFACFASLASLQRIVSGAHYPTDVLAGAAIAFVVTAIFLRLSPIHKLLSD